MPEPERHCSARSPVTAWTLQVQPGLRQLEGPREMSTTPSNSTPNVAEVGASVATVAEAARQAGTSERTAQRWKARH